MLTELAVRDLGVIAEASILLGPGMTALTGETGAGKTLLVTAIDLLVGGRADPALVRPGAAEARVDGRFVGADGREVVLSRVVPAEGRSRAYIDGRPVPASLLAEQGASLVDLHGQHAHQSLLSPSVQRAALDAHGGIDLGPLHAARATLADIDAQLAALGGDERARARELDLVRFQVAELDEAGIDDADEEAVLADEERLLADATAAREAGANAHALLAGEDGVLDRLAAAAALLGARPAFGEIAARMRSIANELGDATADVRDQTEAVTDDPERLEAVGARRRLLRDLRRKYGDTLAEVIAFAADARARRDALESHDARAEALDRSRVDALRSLEAAAVDVRAARHAAVGPFVRAVEGRLQSLAMPGARLEVEVGHDDRGEDRPAEGAAPVSEEVGGRAAEAGDTVVFLLAANPGEPARPLAKVASGGELARVMLALRLALGARETLGPGASVGDGGDGLTLVFDEVDAGIGGEAAVAVGRSLADLAAPTGGARSQVLVVTHLPQVAAHADAQVAVVKSEVGGRTVATAALVSGEERVAELSRMLSGLPTSATAKGHAAELLTVARRGRR